MLRFSGQRLPRWLTHERTGPALGVVAIALIGCFIYGRVVDDIYPIRRWLFWDVARLWLYVGLFNLACVSFGQFVLVRALGLRELGALESAVLAMATGVVGFTLAMYVGGALGWYNPWFAIGVPVVLAAIGARECISLVRRLWQDLTRAERPGLIARLATAAGVVCVGIVYLGIFSPDSVNYDAAWAHIVVAQDYARAGRIVAFPADYNKNVPQLASLIYTWNYLVPGLKLAVRWMLALHSEFNLFVWTLASVAALIRTVVPDRTLRGTWASFFLFPIIFVHDSNLGGAADHVCGFFSAPIALATLLAVETFAPGRIALVAICCAGALLTKYQAAFVIVPAALVIAGCWAWQLAKQRRGAPDALPLRDLIAAPLILLGLGLCLFSPHLLRQLVFHHNPIYPLMQDVFTGSTPTVPDAAFLLSNALADPLYQPEGALWEKLSHAGKLLFTFSFDPHYSFTKDVPAFGSLFTLLLPALLFVKERRRLALLALLACLAVITWGMIYFVDRNLQVFMPVLVAVTGALLVKIWRMGAIARVGLVPLLALQIIWGADALFYSQWTHIEDAMNLIRSGHESRAKKRFRDVRKDFIDMGKAVPEDAKILLHNSHITLGIDRVVWLDGAGFQGMFSYTHLRNARELFDYYRSKGVQYLLWEPEGRMAPTRQEDVLWSSLADGYAEKIGDYGVHRLARMPKVPPPDKRPYQVVALGLGAYDDGLYPIEALNTYDFLPYKKKVFARPTEALPSDAAGRLAMLERADAVFVGSYQTVDKELRRHLDRIFKFTFKGEHSFKLHLKREHFDARQASR